MPLFRSVSLIFYCYLKAHHRLAFHPIGLIEKTILSGYRIPFNHIGTRLPRWVSATLPPAPKACAGIPKIYAESGENKN